MSAMNATPSDAPRAASAFQWRAFTSVVALLSFAVLAASGLVLWMAPFGRLANWGDWMLLGLRKNEWANLHIWFALVFALTVIVHLGFNWRPLLACFKNRRSHQWGFRWEWVAAVTLCAVVFVGVRREFPPFSSLLSFTRDVRQSWGPRGPAANFPSATQTNSTRGVGKPGFEPDKDRGSGGSGYGRQTLAEICAGAGVPLATAQNRLKKSGIQASPQQTLREIADANGFQRPSELLRIIRGESQTIK